MCVVIESDEQTGGGEESRRTVSASDPAAVREASVAMWMLINVDRLALAQVE